MYTPNFGIATNFHTHIFTLGRLNPIFSRHHKKPYVIFMAAALLALPLFGYADDSTENRLSHQDWELVCDNTLTCRAAGYHDLYDTRAISVLLTRKAGPNEPIRGELQIGSLDDDLIRRLPEKFELILRINQRNVGKTKIDKKFLISNLNSNHISALLPAIIREESIELISNEYSWRLSSKGGADILLKMDEIQGRLETPGALVRKGQKSEQTVHTPLPAPIVHAVTIQKPPLEDVGVINVDFGSLRKDLRASLKDDDCSGLEENWHDEGKIFFTKITEKKMLASTECWRGAYNTGYGYWVINSAPPYSPILITTSASYHEDGTIEATHKGRGVGDCMYIETWTWNGSEFIHSSALTTGMCREIAPGGAWSLPTLITDIRS